MPRPRWKRCLPQTKTAAKESSDSTPTHQPRADHTEKLTTSRSGPDRHSGLVQQRIAFEASLEAIPFPVGFFYLAFGKSLHRANMIMAIPKPTYQLTMIQYLKGDSLRDQSRFICFSYGCGSCVSLARVQAWRSRRACRVGAGAQPAPVSRKAERLR